MLQRYKSLRLRRVHARAHVYARADDGDAISSADEHRGTDVKLLQTGVAHVER